MVTSVVSKAGIVIILTFKLFNSHAVFPQNQNSTKVASMDPEHWGVKQMTYEYDVTKSDVKTGENQLMKCL